MILICPDPYAAWLHSLEQQHKIESAEHERSLDAADRLGLQDPSNPDPPRGCLTRRCERCREEWSHGLELSAGEAVCQPCLDAEM